MALAMALALALISTMLHSDDRAEAVLPSLGWGGGDGLPALPSSLFHPSTDLSGQSLRSPFAAGERWHVYSDENYPSTLYGQVRPHTHFDDEQFAIDIGRRDARHVEVLALGSGYAIAGCLTEHMAVVALEVQGHGRFLYAHLDRATLPSWLSTSTWTAVAQGQSLGRLWDNVYPTYVHEVGDDGCWQTTFGEHLHLELPTGAVIEGRRVGPHWPNIGAGLGSTNVRRSRPTCEGRYATLVGSGAGDVLHGTERWDVIISLGGDDVVYGNGGDDLICAGAGDDLVHGGAGHDRVLGEGGHDHLVGDAGHDELLGGTGNDLVVGGDGDDLVSGLDGNDRVEGNRGSDLIYGGVGDDHLEGGVGDDVLYGWYGDDLINAGSGHDYMEGNWGNDACHGGSGADVQYWCETTSGFG